MLHPYGSIIIDYHSDYHRKIHNFPRKVTPVRKRHAMKTYGGVSIQSWFQN
jgi:hypothetical protein